jgi:hypothetical protein
MACIAPFGTEVFGIDYCKTALADKFSVIWEMRQVC